MMSASEKREAILWY